MTKTTQQVNSILQQVQKNEFNNELIIITNKTQDPLPDPVHYKEVRDKSTTDGSIYRTQLEHLFSKGAEVILETRNDFEDAGGPLYIAYILKGPYVEEFNQKIQKHSQIDTIPFFRDVNNYIHRYIFLNPSHIVKVVAGPN